jgi:glucokinase
VAEVPTGCVIGVDLGGTNLKVGLVDPGLATLVRSERVIAALERPALLDALAGAIGELADEEVDAVGLGVACLFDERDGVVVGSTHLPLAGVPLAEVMSERLGLPVFADNDANTALLAEHRAGAAQGSDHALMLTLGTGVGGAIMIGGEPYHGSRGAGGELGHLIVDPDGPDCGPGCPGHGCLEALVSGTALAREARAAGLGEIEGPRVTELARAGDATALAVLTRLGEWLGIGLVSLTNIFNPEVIVIGGGVSAAGELILAPARAVLAARTVPFPAATVTVKPAHFGADAGMIGAAVLAQECSRDRRGGPIIGRPQVAR